jgi:hypothetical protein
MNLFNKIPASAQSAVTVMTLCMPIVIIGGALQPTMLKWYLGGYICLVAVAGMGALFVARKNKKKAAGFSEDLKDNAGETQGVRDPDKLREIDDLRQQFQRGIDIYKQYGKDLYSLPWFVLVGEAGSGKTEALRRSEIGFPDKLQDYWQGTGGTLSMHWWFTSRAVILDTAGRLFVRDGAAGIEGPQPQWISFLQMLRKNRPDCPINGLILVIPATSLIPLADEQAESSSLKEIDAKAGQIAKQMETLQKELGVRFPVYVLVTKTDRIIGFREFFEHIDTPDERYQMLGWSNPAPLDKMFDPRGVAENLRETADRLRRRRMALMKDPVPSPGHKRFDEVDSMFAFPNSFENLAPKLERYLRHIFAVDEWSSKPPFLRGIYFTSALQQGAVLDESLARALGMTVKELERRGGDEDLSLARNRSYFLRDFFLEKVFMEKGLVTKGKTIGKVSGWKLWLPLSFVSALLLVGVVGWLTGRKPPAELKAWRFLADDAYSTQNYGFYPLVKRSEDGTWGYITKPVTGQSLLQNLDQLGNVHLKTGPKFGWLFTPAAVMDGEVKQDRHSAYRVAVDHIILAPITEAAIDGLTKNADRWEAEGVPQGDVEAIEELLALFQPVVKGDDGKPVPAEARDSETTLSAWMRAAGIRFVTSKNQDAYRDTTAPLVRSVKAAHPDGNLPRDIVAKDDRIKFAAVIERALGGGGRTDLTSLLEGYDKAWTGLRALDGGGNYTKAQEAVGNLASASEKLRIAEPQLKFLLSGAAGGGAADIPAAGRIAQRQLGKNLMEAHADALRELAGDRWSRWQSLTEGEVEPADAVKHREELAKTYGGMLPDNSGRNHAARALLCKDILAFEAPEHLNLAAVEALSSSLAKLSERGKALGMEDTAAKLVGFWAEHYIATGLTKQVGFPLVFDQIRGAKERVLSREDAATVSLLVMKLSPLSDRCKTELLNMKGVADSIFDLEKLSKGEVSMRNWELFVRNDWFAAAAEIVVTSPDRPGLELRWNSTNGAEGKLLPADAGARITFLDNNVPPTQQAFTQGNQDVWAPIRWAVARISPQGQGAATVFGGKKMEVLVKLPPTFPTVLDQLPSTKELSE